ncbi:membrane protein [Alicyclobacillus cellulosilyticus]|uniref:Diadenylate cyclase n=1 Tax=Alicyclobacillus cellulosilyticus TaxID=1003997 RepID=A0A917NH52_9BACL|nr:diadenylate cyclase CdaA [Alicyclobacillus cellulosilyticus]GGJ00770.1 membrane protein [Alicyclobacillus cellulosilyticus]
MGNWLSVLGKFTVLDAMDILIVSFVLYRLLLLIRGTRAVQLLKGVLVILVATAVSSALHLAALNWLLNKIITVGLFAIPVVFQPELRRALEQLGRGGFFSFSFGPSEDAQIQQMITEVTKAAQVLAKNKIGALIVVERETGLSEYIETGTPIEGLVTSELLINTFVPNTPLHDGAVIIRGQRIVAAGCFLPLTDNRELDRDLGTRHRAALGVTEASDSVAVVVSEETGQVSLAVDGVITRDLTESALMELLQNLLLPKHPGRLHLFGRKAES